MIQNFKEKEMKYFQNMFGNLGAPSFLFYKVNKCQQNKGETYIQQARETRRAVPDGKI